MTTPNIYWECDGAQIYCGDCLEIMPLLGEVQHVISDPPYEDILHEKIGQGRSLRNDRGKTPERLFFEGIDSIRSEVAAACVAISCGWVLVFTLAEGVREWRDVLQAAGAKYDTCCFWIKPDAMPRFNGQGPARGAECLVTSWAGKGYRSWNGGGKKGIYTHTRSPDEKTGHPTQKPLSLMMELISDFTQPGDIILDPFMGSGTTGEAALKLGRKFIGIEQNADYCAIAAKRMTRVSEQPSLFLPREKVKQGALL